MAEDGWLSERAQQAEAAAPGGFDLADCVREPIHLLGGVQSFGVLIAVDPLDGTVRTVSDNAADHLGRPAADLVGRPARDLVGAEVLAEAGAAGESAVLLTGRARPTGAAHPFDVSAHRRDGLLVLELEPCAERSEAGPGFARRVQQALLRIQRCATVAECCEAAVREVRLLTGYSRVVAYRFEDAEGPGEVVAEDRAAHLEPWLGLWFPASDIPPQARRLYRHNWIRVIGDVDDRTAALHSARAEAGAPPLDLSAAALRTVSAYHLEYLRNIGVRSSMSVSVLSDDALWGLVACHGEEPRWLSPDVRAACELFGSALSVQLAAVADRERSAALDLVRGALDGLLGGAPDERAPSLHAFAGLFAGLVEADGLVVDQTGQTTVEGPDPGARTLSRLRTVAAGLRATETWHTDRLAEALADACGEPVGADAAAGGDGHVPGGVLLLPLGDGFLAWWREERSGARSWATDPAVPVRLGPRGERLTPRGSTEVFRAAVRGRSLPWSGTDLAAAHEVARAVAGLLARHAAWTAVFTQRLERSNADLDAFAHAAAHDLKEPLRGISNAASFVIEDVGDALDGAGRRHLDTVRRLTVRMDGLLDSLLRYSQVSEVGLHRVPVPLAEALEHALEIAGPRLAEQRVRLLRGHLPVVHADPDRLQEVLVNLLVNAAKYARADGPRTVEVTVERRPGPDGGPERETVVVRDNGIGVPAAQRELVFGLFRRLHRTAEHGGGSGAGLAIVRRIVERHGGAVWLDDAPGGGTAVCFTLPEE
ncbi:ATP-binding protein [Kitasatospora sp. NPDC090308]|uniref:ATP-binding protein n=1 Tax=Kitasatospora sp. NPDC090308 TaxID=3364082 RepID=UPI00381BED8C